MSIFKLKLATKKHSTIYSSSVLSWEYTIYFIIHVFQKKQIF